MIFICSSCNNSNNSNNETLFDNVLKIDMRDQRDFNLKDIADFYKIVPLETTSVALIKKIKDVIVLDSLFVIWDVNRILVFNDSGKYLYDIGSKGLGPEQYISIEDVCVKSNEIFILSNARTILKYNISGEYLSSETLPYFAYCFCPSEKGYWLLNYGQNQGQYALLHIDKKLNDFDFGFLPMNSQLISTESKYFVIDEKTEQCFFYTNFQDILYIIEKDSISPYLYVDFGEKKNPYLDIQSARYKNCIEQKNYTGSIHNLRICNKKLFFSFNEYDNGILNGYNVYVDMNHLDSPTIYSFEIQHAEELVLSPLPEIIGLSDEKLVFQIKPEMLFHNDLLEKLKMSKAFENVCYPDITDDSNPILVTYKLRSDF